MPKLEIFVPRIQHLGTVKITTEQELWKTHRNGVQNLAEDLLPAEPVNWGWKIYSLLKVQKKSCKWNKKGYVTKFWIASHRKNY